ncbi:MAG TPA: glycosyltransferase 87 family protein [Candidatus Dormibacteraeota bacterium]|nr:glycosyltransferase 87 family protein [Candidatus Dormibacteraeota bacterium]
MAAAVVLMAWIYVVWGDDHADIGLYHSYAMAAFTTHGAHRLPVEYPILALLPFALTLLPAPDYGVAFVAAMAALVLATFIVVWRCVRPDRARAFVLYLLLAGPWLLFGRFDLFPALVVLLATIAATANRRLVAYALLATGVLLKLYPLVLLPLFVIDQRRAGEGYASTAAGVALFGAIVAAGVAASALLDPSAVLSPITYAVSRPVEAESLPATVLWLLSGFHSPGDVAHSFNSVNVVSSGAPAVVAAFGLAAVVGLVAVYALQLAGRLSLRAACIAALLVVILCNRVFSAQYMVWVVPLVALEIGISPLWIGVLLLTILEYPTLYSLAGLSDSDTATTFAWAFLLVVALRNVLLVAALTRIAVTDARSFSDR